MCYSDMLLCINGDHVGINIQSMRRLAVTCISASVEVTLHNINQSETAQQARTHLPRAPTI